jgi:hypothetical protein
MIKKKDNKVKQMRLTLVQNIHYAINDLFNMALVSVD